MPTDNSNLVLCYNRGCGNTFDPNDNKEDACNFHPGNPVFHDAFKGWSCCNKKCTDFTEFLNIKGCKTSCHSNVKPPEPVKPVVDKSEADKVIEYKAPAPVTTSNLKRPPFDAPLTVVKPEISSPLLLQLKTLVIQKPDDTTSGEIAVGTSCKNGGCKIVYEGPDTPESQCVHHPGIPIFHEGLKFWSCCTKRTTEFSAFLEQVGCTTGKHVWIKEKGSSTAPVCRHDWHQTGSHVIISVYAKKYDPIKSTVELNPIRAKIYLVFPESGDSFDMDIELRGVIDVEKCEASMLPTKVEIKLKKAEPGSWVKLDFPRAPQKEIKVAAPKIVKESSPDDELVDLSDIY